ncbi:MAG TPA: hypothetical protein DDY95_05495 [Bacteroides sp.]|jgi:transcriptional regulator with XRE-family HTH domain|uniref:helix-turn-helix domain-containing protein n=1 Tax=Phocaeicola vulgatus TaxID=821 RepID=UPI000E4E178A|nr:helix-turn-helix transcriptional regulator [Phocaeicola vulgatus]RGT47454.1 XRE family transcriptional regulator [Phocaeicola vulgatus]RHA10314.1 XRE family transcriptional regulator [Phocaeicola vulgatus]HBJ20570.1 hypothetical protein [Bacteroides sp.]
METTVNERIAQIIFQCGYKSKRSFAEKIGVAQTSLNDILRGAEPKYSTLYKILEAEPLISAEWLLRGKGEMLIASSPNEKKEEEAHAESLFRNVLVEFMSMVNKRLKSIDNNTQSSVDKLEGITDLLAELRKTA